MGLMGKDDDIDSVIVSSCIFMEDEQLETQADGVLNRARLATIALAFFKVHSMLLTTSLSY
jgi:hypothetical protein